MPIGLSRSFSYRSKKNFKRITSGSGEPSREEKIQDLKDMIRINEVLIRFYTDLKNPDSPCSFQQYNARLDKEAAELQKRRDDLRRQYEHATNGEIPSLQKQNEELNAKLKTLKSSHVKKTQKRIKRVKFLRERLADLERELQSDSFNIDDLEEMLNDSTD